MEPILIKIVHRLRIAKGTNAKLEILKEHKNNEIWKKFLEYTYDTRKTFGVSAPKDPTFDEEPITDNMFNNLDLLANREVTGNKAKDLAKMLSNAYGEIPRLILGGSVKAGISYTTINKAYPGLIVVFESMKGKDCPITEWPVASSIKYDGVKVFSFVSEAGIFHTSSTGAEFRLDTLTKELTGAKPGVYEGELIHKEGKIIHRPSITGKLNSLLSGTIVDLPKDYDWSYMIYDWIPTEEWANQLGKLSYRDRYGTLVSTVQSFGSHVTHAKCVQQSEISDMDMVIKFYNYWQELGYEGSMHRYLYDVYVWERTHRLVKKKAIRQCILTCVGTKPHSNPAKGITGSLDCSGVITDKDAGTVEVSVNVGSGLSKFDIQFDEDRYINQRVEVLYNSVTKTDKGYSLFIPRYKRLVGGI